jgi:septal ring factor EnvC (AmiA/AmiB activator)
LLAALANGQGQPALAQSDDEKARRELEQLERDIKRINWEIANASSRRNKLEEQLRQSEVELGGIQRSIAENRGAIRSGREELAALETRQTGLATQRDEQQGRIALELKSAWQMGRQGQVKVLLNQESPDTVARSLAYYRHIFAARSDLLEEYRLTLQELAMVSDRIDETMADLQARNQNLEQQQAGLLQARGNRELAMAELSASIDSKGEQLQRKEQDRRKLESLLAAIEEAVDKLLVPDNYQAFSKARGNMPWPVEGRPSNRFGKPRNEGKMRWQGITIPASEGATVRAIHHGRVVYADWLRGSGLLLIIDHGDGYMSLYAHNQSLLRDVGEWVTAGTPISTVGNTGGQDRHALYFEVRHDGKPTDPSNWCRG